MNKNVAAIIVPVYKAELSWWERISLKQLMRVLGKYPIYFVMPENADIPYVHIFPQGKVKTFPDEYFADIKGYNKLLLSPFFYDSFSTYEYIMIYQLDAFVFRDKLMDFCHMGYDYIGAPWFFSYSIIVNGKPLRLHTGNGGFSLRRVESCLWLLHKYAQESRAWSSNEDVFFAYYGYMEKKFRRAGVRIAAAFSFEANPQRIWKKNHQQMPFGCHGWYKYGKNFYLSIANNDRDMMLEYEEVMSARDMDDLNAVLYHIAKFRLLRRIKNGQTIADYLKKYSRFLEADIVIVQGNDDVFLLNALQREGWLLNVQIAADIRQYLPGQRCFILSFADMESLENELQSKCMVYGVNYISFWQEYCGYLRGLLKKMCIT